MWVGSWVMIVVILWVGLGLYVCGLSWVVVMKMDPWTTLSGSMVGRICGKGGFVSGVIKYHNNRQTD